MTDCKKMGRYTLHETAPDKHDLYNRNVFYHSGTRTNVRVGDAVHHSEISHFATVPPYTHVVKRIYANLSETIVYIEIEPMNDEVKKSDFLIINKLNKNGY